MILVGNVEDVRLVGTIFSYGNYFRGGVSRDYFIESEKKLVVKKLVERKLVGSG